MKKVQITYNPYTVQTTILVDDKAVKKDSSLNICENLRLQEWVDKLPQLLCHEYNSREFEIIFRGTQLDFEDIEEIVESLINSEHIKPISKPIPLSSIVIVASGVLMLSKIIFTWLASASYEFFTNSNIARLSLPINSSPNKLSI